jgi:hypothetical protein
MYEPSVGGGVRRARAGGCLHGSVSGGGDVSFGASRRAPLGAFASLVRPVLPTCAVTGGQRQSRALVFINAKVPPTVSSARRCSPCLHAQLATGTAAGARRCELAVLVAISALVSHRRAVPSSGRRHRVAVRAQARYRVAMGFFERFRQGLIPRPNHALNRTRRHAASSTFASVAARRLA